MKKKRNVIFHLIDNLSMGGAELLLKNTLVLLPQFQHIIIYLDKPDTLGEYFEQQNIQLICLQHRGWTSLLHSVIKIKKLIRKFEPVLIHSHLFYSTIIARLSVPAKMPLVSTIHSLYSKDAFEKNRKSLLMEQLTVKKNHALIAVSHTVLKDYLHFVPFKGKKFVLYNFIPDQFFQIRKTNSQQYAVRCIAIGNLKEVKNYTYLLSIFSYLKEYDISLDIYGTGTLDKELQDKIDAENLKVQLRGSVNDISTVLPNYDLFFQASAHEGFGLSVIEAMAARIPVVLSDIPIFKEVTGGHAHFIPLNNSQLASSLILQLKQNEAERNKYIDDAFTYCKSNYTADKYKHRIIYIYESILSKRDGLK